MAAYRHQIDALHLSLDAVATSAPLNVPNGIQIQSAVLPQYTFRTNRQTHTHRSTDGLGNSSILLVLTLAILS